MFFLRTNVFCSIFFWFLFWKNLNFLRYFLRIFDFTEFFSIFFHFLFEFFVFDFIVENVPFFWTFLKIMDFDIVENCGFFREFFTFCLFEIFIFYLFFVKFNFVFWQFSIFDFLGMFAWSNIREIYRFKLSIHHLIAQIKVYSNP